MFKKINEFIKAFKDAYNTINVNKFAAKKAIDDFKKKVDDIVYTADALKCVFAKLQTTYDCFPKKERQDFIQKTLDLLVYGRRDANGGLKDICGWRALWRSQVDYVNTKLKNMNKLYKEGKYNEVISLARECNEHLEEFNILYGIEETQNEENE